MYVPLAQALCEEKLVHAIREFVKDNLGPVFTTSPPVSMEDIHAATSNITPCVFILSSGADPTGILLRFASDQEMSDRLHIISLGQGQGPKASLLKQA